MTRTELKNKFNQYKYSDFERLYTAFATYLKTDYVTFNHNFPSTIGNIVVFTIRENDYVSFNDLLRNNDLLVVIKLIEGGIETYQFNCTTDPSTNKENIAHFCTQIYTGNVGFHRGNPFRRCIRSDNGCWYFRSHVNGSTGIDIFGQIGLNIHDNNNFWNSSLGCTILESYQQAVDVYMPLIKSATNKNLIPVCQINQKFLEGYTL